MRLRVNVRKTKGLIWLMNVVVIICIILVFITIYKKDRGGDFRTRSSKFFRDKLLSQVSEEKVRTDRVVNINRYAAIWGATIDGSRIKKPGGDTDLVTKKDPGRDPAADVIEVTMIVSSPKASEHGLARLNYLKTTEEQPELYREYFAMEGDRLKPPYDGEPYFGKVIKIEPERVVFGWLGAEVSRIPKELHSAAATAPTKSPLEKYRRRPPEKTVKVEENTWALSRNEYHEIKRNHEAILKQVNVSEIRNPKTGKKTVELTEVKEDSLVYKRGFRRGDRLKSINGFPVSTKAGAVNYVDSHPDLGTYVVEVDRMGKSVFMTFVYGK